MSGLLPDEHAKRTLVLECIVPPGQEESGDAPEKDARLVEKFLGNKR
jgi:hypothetical protein